MVPHHFVGADPQPCRVDDVDELGRRFADLLLRRGQMEHETYTINILKNE
jgi:hypothetical protein